MSKVIQQIMNQFQNFDRNQDGDPSIIRLEYLDFENMNEEIPNNGRLVLVLTESRLLTPLGDGVDLRPSLRRYKGDLRAEGFFNRFISVSLYQGNRHQDGRTLLALRSFVKAVASCFSQLAGVILVGSFPEAAIVRRTIWHPAFDVAIAGVQHTGTQYLSIEPGIIAARSEIVLADINGGWDQLYHEESLAIESIRALPDQTTASTAWPVDGGIFTSTAFDRGTVSFKDFFYINDADYTILPSAPNKLQLVIRHRQLHPELCPSDRSLPNPMSRPDILVSRINARNIAVNPKTSIVGDNGVKPLDNTGLPQPFNSNQNLDTWLGFFERDPLLERRVISDYFDRNHQYRTGTFADLPFRAGAIGSPDFGADEGFLAPASSQFQPPLVQNQASVLDYVRWFKQPASLRLITAHSSCFSSLFGDKYQSGDLENELGGHPFRWAKIGNTYTPSLKDQGPHADLYIHRTAWQNKILGKSGQNLIIHGGCEVNAPFDTESKPYYHEGYASWQNAEGLLFYMNGIALISRAKVFNDQPTGFPGAFALGSRTRFGDGWKASFENDAADSGLGTFDQAIRSKKAYFWSMIGDWTVRLRYWNGLGLLGFNPTFRSLQIHPDQAWIDGWNYATNMNTIRGIADLDGDGRSEFIITSDWGIGILTHDGSIWRQCLVAPNDTWFGGWRYNASVNVGKDRIQGTGTFTGGSAHEILLMSSWGIGVLSLLNGTLTSPIIKPNGTRFGGWLFDSRANQVVGIGDLDGNGLDEIVVISDWGIGVLGSSGNSLNSIMLAPNGTRLGEWVLSSRQNTIQLLGDFDGDGRKEILISSGWGLGILKLSGNTLTSIAMHANTSNLDGYVVNTSTLKIIAAGDFLGNRRSQILAADGNGIHLLELRDRSLHRIAFLAQGQRAGQWLLNTSDNSFGPVGDLDRDGKEEIVIRSPWGIGVIGLAQNNQFRCLTLHKYGSHIGDWILEKNDRIVGIGNFSGLGQKSELLIQKGY